MTEYLYVLLTIVFTSYGQLIIKWRSTHFPPLPDGMAMKLIAMTKIIVTDIYVISGFASAYIASMFWLMAIRKLQLNIAYPMMSLSFVLVFFLSALLFHEKISPLHIAGLLFILLGVSCIGIAAHN